MGGWLSEFTLVSYFVRGGVCMYPLALCSLVGLAVILYKWYEFWKANRAGADLMLQVEAKLAGGDREAALGLCSHSGGPLATVVSAGLQAKDQRPEGILRVTDESSAKAIGSLETYLPALATVANISPLLGFLGTVTGMIKAFSAVAVEGLGDPATVAAGIAEALITTATGLFIAIPCFAAYNYFVTRVNRFGVQMEEASTALAEMAETGGVARAA